MPDSTAGKLKLYLAFAAGHELTIMTVSSASEDG
jgi:hypothetical protein